MQLANRFIIIVSYLFGGAVLLQKCTLFNTEFALDAFFRHLLKGFLQTFLDICCHSFLSLGLGDRTINKKKLQPGNNPTAATLNIWHK
jgi:hypothetical protein